MNIKTLSAEFIGTFWLVLGGCGSAVLEPEGADELGAEGLDVHGVSPGFQNLPSMLRNQPRLR